jgi:CDP-diacylglycerol--serine O-phosphatidyltransferase
MSSDNAPRRPFRRIYVLPSLLTMGNFACGFFSLAVCLNAIQLAASGDMRTGLPAARPAPAAATAAEAIAHGHRENGKKPGNRFSEMLDFACFLVLLGMLFDAFDGKVARHVGAATAFGAELDSLADVVTFGLAPPLLVNAIWISALPEGSGWLGPVSVFGAVFALSAALRLARYNIQAATADKNTFSGLPSPAAAGCVVAAVLAANGGYASVEAVCQAFAGLIGGGMTAAQGQAYLLAAFLLPPGVLMVTTIPFAHLANRYFTGKKSFSVLVAAVLILALTWLEPRGMLFAGFNGYMLAGLVMAARKRLRRADAGNRA